MRQSRDVAPSTTRVAPCWCWRSTCQSFVDILNQGEAIIGGVMLPPEDGVWGLPPEMFNEVKGYGADVAQNPAPKRARS